MNSTKRVALMSTMVMVACSEPQSPQGFAPSGLDRGVRDGGTTSEDRDEVESLASSGEGEDDGDPLIRLDVAPDGVSGGDDFEVPPCATFEEDAQHVREPADIVFIVDNSLSMINEAAAVQENLNRFSQQITASGVDVHVALISDYPSGLLGIGICVEPPLGSGGCDAQDSRPPEYLHIGQRVDSHDALDLLLSTEPEWSSVLRPDAPLHIVVVSDDNANMQADEFEERLAAADPRYEDVYVHAIVSMEDCFAAAAIGSTYIELVDRTGGVLSDLCEQDFQPVFDRLATAVVSGSTISCDWPIPSSESKPIDHDLINLSVTTTEQPKTIVGQASDTSACATVEAGWHYDDVDDPQRIQLCPQTCAALQGASHAAVSIVVGCRSIPAG